MSKNDSLPVKRRSRFIVYHARLPVTQRFIVGLEDAIPEVRQPSED